MDIEKMIKKIRSEGIGNKVSPELLEKFNIKSCEEKIIPTRNGKTHIFIYKPQIEKSKMPLYINIHGGGYVKGHREQDIVFCKNICSRANCVVIDIDYETAPEQKYPYAINQCYDVAKWAWVNYEKLGIYREKIAMGGHSAGGNATAAVAIMLNKTGEFKLCLQILDYPALDLYTPPQLKKNAYINEKLSPKQLALYNELYIEPSNRLDPEASPVFAPNEILEGLPEALIITCQKDSLCKEAELYAAKLIAAGVRVTAQRFLNSEHGFVVRRREEFEEAEKIILNTLDRVFKD